MQAFLPPLYNLLPLLCTSDYWDVQMILRWFLIISVTNWASFFLNVGHCNTRMYLCYLVKAFIRFTTRMLHMYEFNTSTKILKKHLFMHYVYILFWRDQHLDSVFLQSLYINLQFVSMSKMQINGHTTFSVALFQCLFLCIYHSIHTIFIENKLSVMWFKTSDSTAFLSHNTATGYMQPFYRCTHTYWSVCGYKYL